MHAARLTWEREAHLPHITEPPPPLPEILVGCSGWFYWHWRDLFYPQNMPTRDWFSHYAEHFHTVELNAPFYSWPTVATVRGWLRQIADRDFIYTVKVSELITHTKRFEGTRTLVRDFGHIGDLLGSRMGCFLFQLPPSFHFTPARLDRIVSQLDPRRRNVIEFRHESWWDERVYEAFRERGIIFCSCSGPRLPDEFVRTADEVYLRFHGPREWTTEGYSPAELEIWARRVVTSAPHRVWAYFNNDWYGHAIHNARTFERLLRESVAL
jgi:uncharacterized protein YecE (DUF72 family)